MRDAIWIKGGRVLDPESGTDTVMDLLIRDGKIFRRMDRGAGTEGVPEGIPEEVYVIDASGRWVMPGLIDLHVHLRDPGQTEKEDIGTGTEAAAAGGFTSIVAMPNTSPVIDSPELLDAVNEKSARLSLIRVYQAGSATRGEMGETLSDIRGMAAHGVRAISEDGKSVMNAALCKKALIEARECKIPFLDHCEDKSLVQGGVVNADEIAVAEGLPGISNDVEDVIIARDIILAGQVGAQLHLCHCSTKGSYYLVKMAKEAGIRVTAEVCPHHFTLISGDRIPGDANYKMNPPLRTEEDRMALVQGLKEGVFDAISTDHAPHTKEEKSRPIRKAPFGIVGLETAVPLTVSELVRPGILTPLQMAERMSYTPANILHLKDAGTLAEGSTADITIIDPEAHYRISAERFHSKGRNTPFDGREVYGKVCCTICGGKIVYAAKEEIA